MYILKGFIAYPSLTNNAIGEVAVLGEISKDSLTYSKETGIYKNAQFPNTVLYTFESYSDVDGAITTPSNHSMTALQVGHGVFGLANDGYFSNNRLQAVQQLQNEVGHLIENIVVGDMLTNDAVWMPEWISYRLIGTDSIIRLWFADSSFSSQYDGFEYTFIPPIETIDDFFLPRANVVGLLAENNMSRLMERIVVAREEFPYTLLRTQEYDWVDPNNTTNPLATNWTVLIYGRAGNDPENIRLALIDWILANSTHLQAEWLAIFPDIFTPTEFIVMPLWHQYAIPNQTIQAGLHSPLITLERALEITGLLCHGVGYEAEHLLGNTTTTTVAYKTLGLLATGSDANKGDITQLSQCFPDYVNVSLSSADFARMRTKTQDWVRLLIDLLVVAETLTQYNTVPFGFNRVIRNGIVYVSKTYHGFQYLVVTRASMVAALGIEAPYYPEFTDDDCSEESRIIREHLLFTTNPHQLTKAQVGLGSVQDVGFVLLSDALTITESTLAAAQA